MQICQSFPNCFFFNADGFGKVSQMALNSSCSGILVLWICSFSLCRSALVQALCHLRKYNTDVITLKTLLQRVLGFFGAQETLVCFGHAPASLQSTAGAALLLLLPPEAAAAASWEPGGFSTRDKPSKHKGVVTGVWLSHRLCVQR